ncbi:MAG: hypothetical protein ACK4HC_01590 [Cloacibacterium sp.]
MKTMKLFPCRFKKIGWLIFIPSLCLGILYLIFSTSLEIQGVHIPVVYNSGLIFGIGGEQGFFKTAEVDWLMNLLGILIIIGGILVGFSAEKNEDEYINFLRLKSVFWSLKISYLIVLILFLTIYGMAFFNVMILSMYLPLVLYVFKFNYLLSRK